VRKPILASLLACCVTLPAAAADEFIVQKVHFNPVMQPQDVLNVVVSCLKDNTCSTIVSAAAGWLGVPPVAVKAGTMIAVTWSRQSGSEESYSTISIPNGYEYCKTDLHMKSVAPADGERASKFWVNTFKDKVVLASWTPRKDVTGGRSWVDMEATVAAVKSSEAERYRSQGKCVSPKGDASYQCQGKACSSSSI
jgi:hypothetical protein